MGSSPQFVNCMCFVADNFLCGALVRAAVCQPIKDRSCISWHALERQHFEDPGLTTFIEQTFHAKTLKTTLSSILSLFTSGLNISL